MNFQSSKTVWFTMQYMKILWNFFVDARNVKNILSGTYFCPNSINIETYTVSTKKVAKMEEPLYLNLAKPSEVENLAFPISLS